jgi:hypothetical protein
MSWQCPVLIAPLANSAATGMAGFDKELTIQLDLIEVATIKEAVNQRQSKFTSHKLIFRIASK